MVLTNLTKTAARQDTGALADQLRRFSEYLQRQGAELFLKAYKVHGIKSLSIQQLRYLEIIEGSPGITPGDLTAAFGVRKPTVTNVVTHLERVGLVSRRRNDRDRRVCRLYPSPRAKAVFRMRRGMYDTLASHISRTLGKNEIDALVRLMKKVAIQEGSKNE